jgi:hypothetical protein
VPGLVGELTWDAPLRLLGGLHALVLTGRAAWGDLDAALAHPELPALAARRIQTNEVRRSWTLLPCFLEVARATGSDDLELIELGSSAGFNLLWDRYRYVYRAGVWGPEDSLLVLDGDERKPVPAGLLSLRPRIRHRVGVDLEPVDVTADEGALLLRSFVWPGQEGRLERLDAAIGAVRRDRPQLVRGDLVELLPGLLARRSATAVTLVFGTAVRGYVGSDRWAQVGEVLEQSGRAGALALVWTDRPAADVHDYWGLWLRLWPDGEPRLLAHADFHGAWLSWLGPP